jgi:cytosine/adenosine deaminase-related metal-dependent hydrolase
MHLLETRYQRAWADANHPEGVVKYLDKIGLLSPRLALAHCVWARPGELELLAKRGVTLATNSSSNLHLRSGVAPVARMMASGCRVAMGIDSQAFDDDGDGLRELRVGELLHAGTGFTPATTRQQMLAMAFANGRFSVTNSDDGGMISPGAPADILLLDWAEIDNDRLRDDIDVLDLLITRASARHIRELIVAGRSIVKDGVVSGVDYPAANTEVIAQMRAGMSQNAALAAALPALEHALAAHYEPDSHCC